MLQPILLRPHGDGYESSPWTPFAAQRARLPTIPASSATRCRGCRDRLIENIQREDLNAIEEAEGYKQLIDLHGHSQDDIGRLVHKSRSHVANLLRLLDLPQFVRDSLIHGEISMGHARAVATAPDPESLAREIIAKGLFGPPTEARARREKKPAASRNRRAARPTPICLARAQLGDMLGLRVKVAHNGPVGNGDAAYTASTSSTWSASASGEPIIVVIRGDTNASRGPSRDCRHSSPSASAAAAHRLASIAARACRHVQKPSSSPRASHVAGSFSKALSFRTRTT